MAAVGKFEKQMLTKTSASKPKATRTQLAQPSDKRAPRDTIVALESSDDAEGFSFWLARVTMSAWCQRTDKTIEQTAHASLKRLKKNHWYMKDAMERYRYPVDTVRRSIQWRDLDNMRRGGDFHLCALGRGRVRGQTMYTMHEGCAATTRASNRRAPPLFKLDPKELQVCIEAAEEKLDPVNALELLKNKSKKEREAMDQASKELIARAAEAEIEPQAAAGLAEKKKPARKKKKRVANPGGGGKKQKR